MSSSAVSVGSGARQRKGNTPQPASEALNGTLGESPIDRKKRLEHSPPQAQWTYWVAFVVVVLLAFATRFWNITYPREVVFDEVHFGKVSLQVYSQCVHRLT